LIGIAIGAAAQIAAIRWTR